MQLHYNVFHKKVNNVIFIYAAVGGRRKEAQIINRTITNTSILQQALWQPSHSVLF